MWRGHLLLTGAGASASEEDGFGGQASDICLVLRLRPPHPLLPWTTLAAHILVGWIWRVAAGVVASSPPRATSSSMARGRLLRHASRGTWRPLIRHAWASSSPTARVVVTNSSADASPIARCSAAGFSLDYRHVAGLLPLRWCGGLVVGVVAAVAWW
jgi:hypothetical protein